MWEKTSASCEILDIRDEEKNKLIKLSENIFRPVMGGQDSDSGRIVKGEEIIKVQGAKIIDGDIYVIVPKDTSLRVGDTVYVEIDLDRRSKLSKLHTGQHILYRALQHVLKAVSFVNVFLTIKDNEPYGELIIEADGLDWGILGEAEFLANKVVFEDRAVRIYYRSPNELDDSIRIRNTLLEKVDKIRIVEVEGFDKVACSGTHVKSTKEIGFIKILGWKKLGRGKRRYKINFSVGENALKFSLTITNKVIEASQEYAFQPHHVKSFIKNLVDENKSLNESKEALIDLIYATILEKTSHTQALFIYHPKLSGKDSIKLLKKISKRYKGKTIPTVILVGNINNNINVAILVGEEKRQRIVEELEKLNYRCWGRKILHCTSSLAASLEELKEKWREVVGDDVINILDS